MDQNAKTQAIERIKEAQNVLITVSTNPSVDQLAAAIGLTLLLNKLDKRATAVFSGEVPSTLEFLRPEETIEQTTDSLRDFIIALDKAKADKLRYKVEDDVVRIFITPYKTKLSDQDLIFSQGDFNVDVVVALGVDNREHIDQAITAHGRILHDATVIGIMASADPVDVGSINWQDPNASSICEMLMAVSESLQQDVIDNQIATAFLTGIVAMTDRFKNERTTPKVMTLSAQLMAAGANQQLIAAELTPTEPEFEPDFVVEDTEPTSDDTEVYIEPVQSEPVPEPEPHNDDEEGVINLHHDKELDEESPELPVIQVDDDAVAIDDEGEFSNADQLREAVQSVQESATVDEELSAVTQNETELTLPEPEIVPEQQVPPVGDETYSRFMTEPPSTAAPLNAIDGGAAAESLPDPLASIPQAGPVGQAAPFSTTESPLLATQHDAESPRAVETPTTPIIGAENVPDSTGFVMPPVPADQTFSDTNMNSANPAPNAAGDSEDAARQAVMDAIGQAGPTPYEPAKQNIGAQFVPLDSEPQLQQDSAPPSVPPPLPFPISGSSDTPATAAQQPQQ